MIIKDAKNSEKKKILYFCKNTFSWGDYIAEVWDFWIKEGNLLVAKIDDNPVGMCHASINSDSSQVWIEGIRIHPNFRRRGIAKKLVLKSESIAKNSECKNSFMLIDVDNTKSFQLAKNIGYEQTDVWTFYQLEPQKISFPKIHFIKSSEEISIISAKNYLYVDSWRWYPLDKNSIFSLIKNNCIVATKDNGIISGLATLTDSQHFDGTLLVTILEGNQNDLDKILEFLQNYGFEKNLKRIQILTKFRSLPKKKNLKKRLLFSLMKKEIT